MRVRQLLLVAALVAASATVVAAQADPRPWPRYQWRYQRPFLHYRLSPDRMRTLERALERAEQVRERARVHSLERLNTLRDRELAVRDRLNDRMRGQLWRGMAARDRAMERVRERLDRVREEQWLSRRRWRRI
ncbi:MAG TPA: hypothetical protein VJ817_13740 [Gemmatimonadales bacterium]|nr:hypothetical protein [Gemmatimonadales bacterium]